MKFISRARLSARGRVSAQRILAFVASCGVLLACDAQRLRPVGQPGALPVELSVGGFVGFEGDQIWVEVDGAVEGRAAQSVDDTGRLLVGLSQATADELADAPPTRAVLFVDLDGDGCCADEEDEVTTVPLTLVVGSRSAILSGSAEDADAATCAELSDRCVR